LEMLEMGHGREDPQLEQEDLEINIIGKLFTIKKELGEIGRTTFFL